jgi:hypothetical protein
MMIMMATLLLPMTIMLYSEYVIIVLSCAR